MAVESRVYGLDADKGTRTRRDIRSRVYSAGTRQLPHNPTLATSEQRPVCPDELACRVRHPVATDGARFRFRDRLIPYLICTGRPALPDPPVDVRPGRAFFEMNRLVLRPDRLARIVPFARAYRSDRFLIGLHHPAVLRHFQQPYGNTTVYENILGRYERLDLGLRPHLRFFAG